MTEIAMGQRLVWRLGRVVELITETPRCKSIVLDVPGWPGHRAGQHVDVRLTADDGYQTERSYSIASSPEDGGLALTVERLDDGEVSPYLVDELRVGDDLELRGPVGGYFVWEHVSGGPLQMFAGGSGVVPLRAMLRHWAAGQRDVPARLIYSSRSLDDVIYRDELARLSAEVGADVRLTLTREWPEDWDGLRGRIHRQLLNEIAWPRTERPLNYVCGPTAFVEAVAEALVAAGHERDRIRTERFGPSGS
jgi:ferredoxin-NADP reductase